MDPIDKLLAKTTSGFEDEVRRLAALVEFDIKNPAGGSGYGDDLDIGKVLEHFVFLTRQYRIVLRALELAADEWAVQNFRFTKTNIYSVKERATEYQRVMFHRGKQLLDEEDSTDGR